MNDLGPWKIWAVTGALVVAILGCAAMRVRPQDGADGIAQASTLTTKTDERSTPVTSEPTQSADQYEGYFSGTSRASNSQADYSVAQSTAIVPNQPNALASISNPVDDNDQQLELDVTQQILSTDTHQGDVIVSFTLEQPTDEIVSWFPATASEANQNDWEGIDYPVDQRAYVSVLGSIPINYSINLSDGNGTILLNQSELGEVRLADNALKNAVIQVAFNGENSNGNGVVVLRGLNEASNQAGPSTLVLTPDQSPVEMDGESIVNMARVQVLTEAAAEADALAQAEEAQQVEGLTLQQAAPIYYTRTAYQYW